MSIIPQRQCYQPFLVSCRIKICLTWSHPWIKLTQNRNLRTNLGMAGFSSAKNMVMAGDLKICWSSTSKAESRSLSSRRSGHSGGSGRTLTDAGERLRRRGHISTKESTWRGPPKVICLWRNLRRGGMMGLLQKWRFSLERGIQKCGGCIHF